MPRSGWARVLDKGVRWAVVVPGLGTFLGAWRSFLAEFVHLDVSGQSALLLLGALHFGVAALLLFSVRNWVVEAVVAFATAAAMFAFALSHKQVGWDAHWWPTSIMVMVLCWVLAFGSRFRWWTGGVALVLFAGVRLWAGLLSGDSWRMSVADLVISNQLVLTVILGLAAVRRVADASDEAEQEHARALREEAARSAATNQARRVARFLHDDVSHALRAVAQARVSDDPAVQALAGRAVGGLQSGDLRVGSAQPAADLRLIDRLELLDGITGVRAEVTGRDPRLPLEVTEAIVSACAEALRNVARHAGTATASIRVRTVRSGVVVAVVDHGRGMPEDVTWGVGINESMVGRMSEIGGAVAIRSSGAGTTVEFSWSPAGVTQRVDGTWRELTREMTPMVIPGLVGTVLLGLLMFPYFATPALAVAGLVVFAASGSWALVRGTRENPMRSYALLIAAGVIAFALNVLAVSPDIDNGYQLFLAGGSSALLLMVAIQHRFGWSLLAMGVLWLALFGLGATRFGLDAITGDLFGALTAPTTVLGILLPRAVLSRFVRRALCARDETLRTRLRVEHLTQRHGAEDARLGRTRRRVVPFLRAVAEDRVDLRDPAVRQAALRLEATVRDELRFGGPDDLLAAAVDETRRAGWQLEIRVRPAQRRAVTTGAKVLLLALGADGSESGTAFLSAFGEVALVVRNPAEEKLREWREHTEIDLEEGDQWCRLTVRALAPRGATTSVSERTEPLVPLRGN